MKNIFLRHQPFYRHLSGGVLIAAAMAINAPATAQFAGSIGAGTWVQPQKNDWQPTANMLLAYRLPLGNQSIYVSAGGKAGAGMYQDAYVSLTAGYRLLSLESGFGFGINGGVERQKSQNRNHFTWAAFGAEIFMPGGFSLQVGGRVPVGTKERVVSGTAQQGGFILRDKEPGSCAPNNPTRVCVPVFQNRQESVERSNKVIDILASYRLPVFQKSDVFIYGGGYRVQRPGKDLDGVVGGIDARIELFGGLQLAVSSQVQHDHDHKKTLSAGVGVQWNFGATAAIDTPRQRQLLQPPRRLSLDEQRVSIQEGAVSEEPAIWDYYQKPVSEIRFVNSNNADQIITQANALADFGVLLVDGKITIPVGSSLELKAKYSAVMGGGINLNFTTKAGDRRAVYQTPGGRGEIIQTDSVLDTIILNKAEHVLMQGFDIRGGATGLKITESQNIIARDIYFAQNATAIDVQQGAGVVMQAINIDQPTRTALRIDGLRGGIWDGVDIFTTATDAEGIVVTGRAEEITLRNIRLQSFTGVDLNPAIQVIRNGGAAIILENINVGDWNVTSRIRLGAFVFDRQANIADGGGNTSRGITKICDRDGLNAVNGLQVTNLDNGALLTCQ